MLTTDDLFKIEKLMVYLFDERIGRIEKDLSKVKDEQYKMKDVLIRHDNYLKSEQKFIIKHIDENSLDIKKIKRNLVLINSRLKIDYSQ